MISAPITVQLEVTEKCNYRCPHCYHLVNDNNPGREFNFRENDENVLSIARELVNANIFNVVLTGGEPLTKKKLTLKLIKYFRARNVNVSLNTNLVLMDDDFLDKFINFGGNGMLISCPASTPKIYKEMTGNGNFRQFSNKVQKLVKKNVHFTVNMVVNKNNLRVVRETATKMIDLGVRRFAATPMALNVLYPDFKHFLSVKDVRKVVRDLVWVKKNFGIYVDIMEALPKCVFPKDIRCLGLNFLKRKCQAGITTMAVSTNGDIRPCTHNPQAYGNIFKENLSNIWEKMFDWRNGFYVPQDCKRCRVLNICLGGCRMTAKAYDVTGQQSSKDPWMLKPLRNDDFRKENVNFDFGKKSIIRFSGKFQFRREGDGYLIYSAKNKILLVNDEFFALLKYLEKVYQIRLDDLANRNNISFNDRDFQKIIKLLLRNKFISLNKQQKGGQDA
ncbi:MAG: radical SAM protein [Mariniphaga sp.]|nr:radical SAM protein [Mariniphaga sp.]